MNQGVTLHIFNPSHDEALAAHSPYYYPSKIARHLANEWGALPMLWASENDYILLPDEAVKPEEAESNAVHFIRPSDLNAQLWNSIHSIQPWGWDALLVHQLRKVGAPNSLLPTEVQLDTIRQLSSRNSTTLLLPQLRAALLREDIPTVGQSVIATTLDEVMEFTAIHQRVMVKSLWSCSGRGVFQVGVSPTASVLGRIRRLLREQGAVEVEPLYDEFKNFALEFDALPNGRVSYVGLSLFTTSSTGGYTGNRVASQSVFEAELSVHFSYLSQLITIAEQVLTDYLQARYVGPLGIDMMLVSTPKGIELHPCIELNLRRTMGYVAWSVSQHMEHPLPAFARALFRVD